MNTNPLARYYTVLTPWERLALLVAAAGRADEVESRRLVESAPKVGFRLPNYWGLAEGLESLAKLYLLRQLDAAAIYWRVMGVLNQEPLEEEETATEQKRHDRLWRAVQTLAFRFVVRADGWKLLCRQLQIDPDVVLRDLPGYEAVCQMEGVARLIACTAEEALACLREGADRDAAANGETSPGRRDYRLDTAEEVARSMRACLAEQLAAWS
jgi:hypothetical protein